MGVVPVSMNSSQLWIVDMLLNYSILLRDQGMNYSDYRSTFEWHGFLLELLKDGVLKDNAAQLRRNMTPAQMAGAFEMFEMMYPNLVVVRRLASGANRWAILAN